MKRPVAVRWRCRSAGYTLIELLVATTLALLLMGAVVVMFGRVAESITDSRSMLEAAERLRLAATRLQMDLSGVTVTMNPPRKPENNEGYFEYIEGPVGPSITDPSAVARNIDNGNQPDPTVGDFDDILMFTTRSTGRPFVGKFGAGTIQSDVAEVAWFLRGRTLHRRVLLVAPSVDISGILPEEVYANYDVSVRVEGGVPVANTLGDLTRRECRFAHVGSFPYDINNWDWTLGGPTFPTLPTLNECSFSGLPGLLPDNTFSSLPTPLDFWTNDSSKRVADNALIGGNNNYGSRVADDVILTNVIGFDVKAWDPDHVDGGTTGHYVDLGSGTGRFSAGNMRAVDQVPPTSDLTYPTYDTWSTHYESVGIPGGTPGQALNGLDDAGVSGIVDDADELLTSPPYPYPLRGIQVKIRVFEPDSRQIREVTVVQDFLPQ